MRKQLLCWISLLALCSLLSQPLLANAAPLETDRACSLILSYTKDGMEFGGEEIRIYRVAQAFSDGSFTLIDPFASYPVNIYGITSQKEWKDTAGTLTAYIAANQNQPDRIGKTDKNGNVTFDALDTGLYLVSGVVVENDSGTYIFDDFMVYLPAFAENGAFDYDVEAKPKCTNYIPKTEYKVLKLWKDEGYAGSRPKNVTIDILKDNIVQETRVLCADNNWSYSFRVSADDMGKWTVIERDVSDEYTVIVSENEGIFTVTNTRRITSAIPPKTGDSSAVWYWFMLLGISGSLLIILGIYEKRKQK